MASCRRLHTLSFSAKNSPFPGRGFLLLLTRIYSRQRCDSVPSLSGYIHLESAPLLSTSLVNFLQEVLDVWRQSLAMRLDTQLLFPTIPIQAPSTSGSARSRQLSGMCGISRSAVLSR